MKSHSDRKLKLHPASRWLPIVLAVTFMMTLATVYPSAAAAEAITWDPSSTTGTMTLSDGNLTTSVTGTEIGNAGGARTTQSVTSGKHYWEVTMNCPLADTAGFAFGVGTSALSLDWSNYFFSGQAWSFMSDASRKFNTGSNGSLGDENGNFGFPDAWPRDGDVMQFALDMDSGKIWFGINCTWLPAGSGADPVAGTNPAYSGLPSELYATMMMASRQCGTQMSATANFGATPPDCPVPTDFGAGFGATVSDSDNDGVPDDDDICPGGDDTVDTDDDTMPDFCDACPLDAANDADEDGVCGDVDNCPLVANTDQADTDGEGTGDACNEGDDNDGDEWSNGLDNCPDDSNPTQADTDEDGMGDACDSCPLDAVNDIDTDGVCGNEDNCPTVANSGQADTPDGDGEGNACDLDDDNDGFNDDADNCPLIYNDTQADYDNDGEGDACDDDVDGDNVVDAADECLGTTPGALVDAAGCALAQLCPCDNAWKNHGAYVKCVAHAANDFRDAGLISGSEHGDIVSEAGMSSCGHKN